MKNLKKFENWIDDETADTNRRLAELDNKANIDNDDDDEFAHSEKFNKCFTEMSEEISVLLNKYKDQYPEIFQDFVNDREILDMVMNCI
jgi:predicted transcriptional regulator